jgi:hypothetical protein
MGDNLDRIRKEQAETSARIEKLTGELDDEMLDMLAEGKTIQLTEHFQAETIVQKAKARNMQLFLIGKQY